MLDGQRRSWIRAAADRAVLDGGRSRHGHTNTYTYANTNTNTNTNGRIF